MVMMMILMKKENQGTYNHTSKHRKGKKEDTCIWMFCGGPVVGQLHLLLLHENGQSRKSALVRM